MLRAWCGAIAWLMVVAATRGVLAADPAAAKPNEADIAATINRLMEASTRTAMATLDAEKTLEPLSKDRDAVFFFGSKPYARGELIQVVRKMYGTFKSMSLKMDKVNVKVLGPDAAVWIAVGKGKAVSKSGESSEEYLLETWIWQKLEGKWQVVHYHESAASLPNAEKRGIIEKALSQFAAKLQKNPPTAQSIAGTIEKFLAKNPGIVGSAFALNPARGNKASFYVYRSDTGFARRSTPTSYNYTEADWYAKSAHTGKTEWSEPYYDSDGAGLYMVTCSIPVYSKEKELLGVITADLGLY